MTQSNEELGLEARNLSNARSEKVNSQALHTLGPGEPVRSAVKVRSEALRVFERAPATPHRDREARKAALERALDLNQSRVLLRPAQVVENYHNPHRGLRRNSNGNRDRNTVRGVGHGVATDRPGDRPRALRTLPKVLVQVESPETTRHTLEVAGTRLQQPIPVLRVPAEAVSQRRRATAERPNLGPVEEDLPDPPHELWVEPNIARLSAGEVRVVRPADGTNRTKGPTRRALHLELRERLLNEGRPTYCASSAP